MKMIIKGGLWIGVLCGLWILVMGITGWYKDPVWANMFWMVIVIQIGVLVWMLRGTEATGARYGRQVANGTMMSLAAGIILFGISLLYTLVLYPHYFEEIRAAHAELLRSQGKSEADIAQVLQATSATQTPLLQALSGLIGTVVTGLLASLVLATFLRTKASDSGKSPV